jgi:hypothetical protein
MFEKGKLTVKLKCHTPRDADTLKLTERMHLFFV